MSLFVKNNMRYLVLIFYLLLSSAYGNNEYDYKYDYMTGDLCEEAYDPYEKLNRKIFIFNITLDRLLLRPLALGYSKVTNSYIQARVASFLENLTVPFTGVNYAIQTNFAETMRSVWRFIINSTLGLGGIFDIAGKIGLAQSPQSFGNSLAYYGASPGAYLVIPFMGSAMGRDAFDLSLINNAFSLITKIPKDLNLSLMTIKVLHDRSNLLAFTDFLEKNSTDYYIAVRTAIYQKRESAVKYPKNFKCPKHINR